MGRLLAVPGGLLHSVLATALRACEVLQAMPLLSLRNLTLSFGGPALLQDAQLTIEPRERVCLIGRNGEGKSSLLKVILGHIQPDSGEFERQPGLKISILAQDPRIEIAGTVYDVVAQGAGEQASLLAEYHHLAVAADPSALDRMHSIQHKLEASGGWGLDRRIAMLLEKLGLEPELSFNTLSGGMKRRTMLAQALVSEPDLLLLDEPTNHLDLDSIRWLEDFMLKYDRAVLFITHDRAFLRKVATRILELDRGKITSWDCGYDTFLERRAALHEAEAERNKQFDKKLALEEAWLRRGVKARRTRNEGRVLALKKLRAERSERREVSGTARLQMQESQGSGRKAIVVEGISKSYGGIDYIRDFSSVIWRGDKIGLIGPNGSGKSTLLKMLLRQLEPDRGSVEHGTRLEIAYFDQHRSQLDESKTLMENVWDKGETITFDGKPMHIITYLQRFLFDADRARAPIDQLSGGERNRLLLAKLFVQPANVYVLDEPTNDLDLETMELLEDLLADFSGTLLLVSHDREFLNNVVASIYSLEGQGRVVEYNGGYDDYLRLSRSKPVSAPTPEKTAPSKGSRPARERTITNVEQRELDALPQRIEELEAKRAVLLEGMGQPDFFKSSRYTPDTIGSAIAEIEREQEIAFARWEELEALPKKR